VLKISIKLNCFIKQAGLFNVNHPTFNRNFPRNDNGEEESTAATAVSNKATWCREKREDHKGSACVCVAVKEIGFVPMDQYGGSLPENDSKC